jgi:hypothetical protein
MVVTLLWGRKKCPEVVISVMNRRFFKTCNKRIVSGKARKGIHTTVLIVEICNLIQYIGVVDLL